MVVSDDPDSVSAPPVFTGFEALRFSLYVMRLFRSSAFPIFQPIRAVDASHPRGRGKAPGKPIDGYAADRFPPDLPPLIHNPHGRHRPSAHHRIDYFGGLGGRSPLNRGVRGQRPRAEAVAERRPVACGARKRDFITVYCPSPAALVSLGTSQGIQRERPHGGRLGRARASLGGWYRQPA